MSLMCSVCATLFLIMKLATLCQCLFTHKWSSKLYAPSGAASLHLSCQNGLVATSETRRSLGSNRCRPFKHNSFILGHGVSLSRTSSSLLRSLPACSKVIDFSGCQFTQIRDAAFYILSAGRGVWSNGDEADHNHSWINLPILAQWGLAHTWFVRAL